MIILTKNFQTEKSKELHSFLAIPDFKNVFNPSVVILDRLTIIAFRAIPGILEQEIQAFVGFYSERGGNYELINISDYVKKWGIAKAADPKLFKNEKGDVVWVTFNTGYVATGNELYIMQVFPKLGSPIRCSFPPRKKIEKNWAFYFDGDVLMAVYSLTPLKILQAPLKSERNGNISFITAYEEKSKVNDSLSIGTQLLHTHGGFECIAHKKITLFGKRIYIGIPVRIVKKRGVFAIECSKIVMFHSIRSLFGAKIKHNKNLISCTYFSGIEGSANKVRLAYGINDVAYGFAEIDRTKLWK